MDDAAEARRNIIRTLLPRLAKASMKAVIIYIVFAALSTFMAPIAGVFDYQGVVAVPFALYLALIFLVEVSRGAILQYIFSAVNHLAMMLYFSYVMNSAVVSFAVDRISLTVDLRFFIALLVLASVLGFAKNMMQLLDWLNTREEHWLRYQTKSL
jgi:hypothetical protein